MRIQRQWCGTHNKAILKTSSAVYGIDIYVCFKIFQHKFATTVSIFPTLFTYKGDGIFILFSFRIFNFYSFSLFVFFFSLHIHFSKATNPKKSSVIIQGTEEGMYWNKALESAVYSHCVFKLPYQTVTCPPLPLSDSFPKSPNALPHIPLRKNSLNTNLFSSVSSKLQAFHQNRVGFHQISPSPLTSSSQVILVSLSSSGSDSLASRHSLWPHRRTNQAACQS